MLNFRPRQILSMTELQKLSLKRLRQLDLAAQPLLVMDRKSDRKAFVIVDYETFLHGREGGDLEERGREKQKEKGDVLGHYDFRSRGLFWDRPELTNRQFVAWLKDPRHTEHVWAISRLLERLPSQEMVRLFSLSVVVEMLKHARIREAIRRPWEHAIHYWRQKT